MERIRLGRDTKLSTNAIARLNKGFLRIQINEVRFKLRLAVKWDPIINIYIL